MNDKSKRPLARVLHKIKAFFLETTIFNIEIDQSRRSCNEDVTCRPYGMFESKYTNLTPCTLKASDLLFYVHTCIKLLRSSYLQKSTVYMFMYFVLSKYVR